MKKLLTAMCLSMLALAMAGALAACNENPPVEPAQAPQNIRAIRATCEKAGQST